MGSIIDAPGITLAQGNAIQAAAAASAASAANSLAALNLAGTTTTTDFTVSAQYQRTMSPISNPDTRYDVAVVSGNLQADLRQAAVLFYGARSNIARRGGRVYRVRMAFDATLFGAQTGVSLGFDPSNNTGANVQLDALAVAWAWRSGGTVTAYGADGVTSNTNYAFTLTPGSAAVPSFVASDVVALELTENNNAIGGVLRGYKNGVLAFTGSVIAVPQGRLVALARGIGAGAAYPSAARMTLSQLIASDPVPLASTTTINTGPSVTSSIISTPGLARAQPVSPVRDANAFLQRVPPPGFSSWLPIFPSIVNGAGDVRMNNSSIVGLFQKYPLLKSGLVASVETTGNDSTGVAGNPLLPYLTINAALQSSATIVVVGNGVFGAAPDYRYTQAAAGAMKLVMAKNRGLTTIRQPGDALATNTWTATPSQTGVYQTTVAQAAGQASWTAYAPHIVRLTDALDSYGFPARLPYFAPATLDATGVANAVAALQAAGYGWTYDGASANKVLYVALNATSVITNSARLQALYNSLSGTDRVFISGGNLAIDGIYFDGQSIWQQEYNASGVYIPSSYWGSNCWHISSPSYGVQADSNCTTILDNCRIHGSASDGLNSDSTRNGSGAVSRAMLSGCFITESGDVATYGTSISANRQAISSHSGYLAGFGCLFEKNWGQEVADTGSGTGPSYSWYVGCIARNGDVRLGSARVGFGFYDPNRIARLDTCVSLAEGTNPFHLEGGASAKTYNCTFDQPEVDIPPSVPSTSYTPDAP